MQVSVIDNIQLVINSPKVFVEYLNVQQAMHDWAKLISSLLLIKRLVGDGIESNGGGWRCQILGVVRLYVGVKVSDVDILVEVCHYTKYQRRQTHENREEEEFNRLKENQRTRFYSKTEVTEDS